MGQRESTTKLGVTEQRLDEALGVTISAYNASANAAVFAHPLDVGAIAPTAVSCGCRSVIQQGTRYEQ